VALALFDLDNTLLNGDSDHSWGLYLCEIGAVDAEKQRIKQDEFYQQYLDGVLDIFEFCEFQFSVLRDNPVEKLYEWRADFMQTVIEPMIIDFVTQPIAERLGVKTLLATKAEFADGAYTGNVSGTPCYQDGKVTRLKQWLGDNNKEFKDSFFYSDSINDLPLLELVDKPIAVTPDDRLRSHAEKFHWQIID